MRVPQDSPTRIREPWGDRTPYAAGERWPERVDLHLADGHGRAANELTLTEWDPVSKQPLFKTAAARVERVRAGERASAATGRRGGVER